MHHVSRAQRAHMLFDVLQCGVFLCSSLVAETEFGNSTESPTTPMSTKVWTAETSNIHKIPTRPPRPHDLMKECSRCACYACWRDLRMIWYIELRIEACEEVRSTPREKCGRWVPKIFDAWPHAHAP